MKTRFAGTIAVLAACLSACMSPVAPSPSTPTAPSFAALASGDLPLITHVPIIVPSGGIEVCAGVGLSAVLRGSADDPRLVWLVNQIGSGPQTRIEAVWPAGYRVRFDPKAEILDGSGRVVLSDGDPVTGTCGKQGDGSVYLVPPFQ